MRLLKTLEGKMVMYIIILDRMEFLEGSVKLLSQALPQKSRRVKSNILKIFHKHVNVTCI